MLPFLFSHIVENKETQSYIPSKKKMQFLSFDEVSFA